MLELNYFMPVQEAADFEIFCDWLSGEVGEILTEMKEDNFNFELHEESLLRIVESTALISSLAEQTGKSVAEVEALWDQAKQITHKEYNKTEDSDGFYAITVGILKKSLGLK
jgi:NTP pyrophosphatase (non-canonical NTP hydrolase)